MSGTRTVVMGAGEVGRYLARTLSLEGASVTLIDLDEEKREVIEEQLDVAFVHGNGGHLATLEAAGVGGCDLFVAASSADEANLVAARLAKLAGAARTVVRVSTAEEITEHGSAYEEAFDIDLMLSTQLLATTQIINNVLGYNTLDIEYLAKGQLQVRKAHVDENSVLCRRPLSEIDLPDQCLVLAFSAPGRLVIPTGDDKAEPGDDVLLFAVAGKVDALEERVAGRATVVGTVVIAGGGSTAREVAKRLAPHTARIKIIERDRSTAEALAAEFPQHEIIHGDATELAALKAENVGSAQHFIALTGHDESNLMACLLAEELGARQITALVDRSDTSSLWRKFDLLEVVSPRVAVAAAITEYTANDYQRTLMSVGNGTAQFVQRRIASASPAAGATLAEIAPPRGMIIAAILRDGRALVPSGGDRLVVGDDVIVFAHRSELPTVQLLFPGADRI